MTTDDCVETMSPANSKRYRGSMKARWPGACPGVWTATSTNGQSWSVEQDFPSVPGADPGAVKLNDGAWLLAVNKRDGTTVWEGERLAEFHAARADVLALHLPVDQPGIPMHKLGAPDGWIVTAGECRDALTAYDRHRKCGGTYPAAAFGDSFVPFLTACADGDGFLVT